MDLKHHNMLFKEFHKIGKLIVWCNEPKCFEDFYYYYRFGFQDSTFVNNCMIRYIIILDRILFNNNCLSIDIRNYIYYYFLNLEQCEWIEYLTSLYLDNNNKKISINNINHNLLNNIKYFDDIETQSIFKIHFGHCNGIFNGKIHHFNDVFTGFYCIKCHKFYCELCKNDYLKYHYTTKFMECKYCQ